ncbi:TetR family transcriptional regulator [Sphingomonas oleivorans]|uniref:TetR family transcriptional regulator n=1 Tax=Sphingomonas oleivorans TaxID=1735121 RepID=A0A2T5FWY8_9SPHN|nr:TetR/AcrR family transcriptional regulator [Sphingomonas oleivorans]PTQ10307.1 TetR family transcriptional regulator [Sphingomonas oleivorans]
MGCSDKKTAAQRVFETAQGLFYQRGIRAVGVDEIVAQAGVTKPSLYRSFASKDDLVTACLNKYVEEAHAALDARVAAVGDDPREKLRAYVAFFAEKIAQPDYRGCALSNAAVEFPEPGHPGRCVMEASKTRSRDQLSMLARQLPTRDPDALADNILLLIEGAQSSHHVFGSQGPAQAIVKGADALIEAFTTGDMAS